MNLDDLTIGDARRLAAMFGGAVDSSLPANINQPSHEKIPAIVCTDKRGVVFGYCTDTSARPAVTLTDARMCLYWDTKVGGVFGLGEIGPNKDCKISARIASIVLEGVTAIMSVDPVAEKAWLSAKVQGR